MKSKIPFFSLIIFVFFAIGQTLAQQGTCPRNAIDCKHGCGRFIDADNDGYCDYSLLSDAVKQMLEKNKATKNENTSIKNDNSDKNKNTATSVNKKNTNKNTTKSQNTNPKDSIKQKVENIAIKVKTSSLPLAKKAKPAAATKKPYDLITLSIITLSLYLFTFLLVRFNIIHRCNHRKIWNTLLLVTFLMACVLGLILVIQINYNVLGSWYRDFLFLHVEFGIAMTLIAIFHILWHWRYFKNLFKSNEKNKKV